MNQSGSNSGKLETGNWKLKLATRNRRSETGNWKLELEAANWLCRDERGQTNPMQLRDLISIECEERTQNKPNGVIHNYINMLREFLASFCRNTNDKQLEVPFPIRQIFHDVNGLE
jgi:hypothetical protein